MVFDRESVRMFDELTAKQATGLEPGARVRVRGKGRVR